MGLLEDLKSKLFKRESKGYYSNNNNNINNTSQLFSRYTTTKKNNGNVSYREGRHILKDGQVKTAFLIFKHILSSKKYNLSSPDDNTETIEFIDDMLKNMSIEIVDLIGYILTGVLWGFSANELIFNVNSEQKLVITNIIPINQSTLENNPFNFNDDGDVTSIHQTPPNDKAVDIPIEKILLYTYADYFDSPYGEGILQQLKPIIKEKEDLNNWLMTYAKRHASPLLVGKSDNPSSRNGMLDAFDDVNAGATGITVGLEETIESVGGTGSADDYKTIIQMKDNEILRLFFIPDLLMTSNTTGSYAQSKTQLDFLYSIYNGILEDIANTIQRQIINPIIQFNFGEDVLAPVFSFDKFDDTDYKELFDIVNGLISTGTLSSDNQTVHEALGKMFRATCDIEYNKDNNNDIVEDFNLPPVNGETLTQDSLEVLNNNMIGGNENE